MKWTDVDDIVELLERFYPNQDIFALRFTNLRDMITELPGFDPCGEECNESILETIQMAWSEERE